MIPRRWVFAFAVLALAMVGCNQGRNTTEPAASPTTESTSPTEDIPAGPDVEGTIFRLQLTGAEEVPGPGDPDGTGSAEITIDVEGKQVCYELVVSNIGAATLAHIHSGAKGIAGEIVIELIAPNDGSSEGCVAAPEEQLNQIEGAPASFYVNVHNEEFPQGAVRGQLA